jgi:hypothetical protein
VGEIEESTKLPHPQNIRVSVVAWAYVNFWRVSMFAFEEEEVVAAEAEVRIL